MTAADNNRSAMERVLTEFGGFVACLDNVREKGCIYGTGAWKKGDILKTGAMRDAYEMGKHIQGVKF